MIKRILWVGCLMFLAVGCAHGKKKLSYADYPVHVYEQPFDLVYKTAIDILAVEPGWILNPTDKSAGIISLTSTTYANIMSLDAQKAQFVVRSVNRKQTSIEFDPAHSVCRDYNCHKLLEKINLAVSVLPARIEVPKQPTS